MSSDSYRSDERNTGVLKSKIFRPKNDASALTRAFQQRRQRAQRKRMAV